MTPEQKIKQLVIIANADLCGVQPPEINEANVDDLYAAGEGDDWGLQDAREEVRGGEFETGIPCDWSRHYESKSVAAKAPDGSWVGWTYWYGGGKHGEPEGIDWMDSAYDLDVTEEEKVVTVRTFAKAAPLAALSSGENNNGE